MTASRGPEKGRPTGRWSSGGQLVNNKGSAGSTDVQYDDGTRRAVTGGLREWWNVGRVYSVCYLARLGHSELPMW